MFGRRRRATVGKYVDAPLVPLAPIERVVEEGALIYVAAARMTVKNRIIVAAIGEHRDYAPEALRDSLRRELERLADDNDETVARLEGAPPESEDPLDDDVVRQKREDRRRRPEVLRLTAAYLRGLARSEAHLESLVEQARADAVEEMFRAIDARLAQGVVQADATYQVEREQRLRDFVAYDLLGATPEEAPAAREETVSPAPRRPLKRRKRDRE